MTEQATPTEEAVVDNPGVEESTLPGDESQEAPAVDNVEDTEQQEESDSDSSESTEEEKEDKELAKFAKAQGFDPDNLTDGEKRALKIARDNQRALRQTKEAAKPSEIEKNINEVDSSSEMSDREYTDFRLNQQNDISNVRQYWAEHPEERQYEPQAIAILLNEKEKYGDAAMIRLYRDMPRLVREAKFAAGAFDEKAIVARAQKEERERIRREQEGSADSLNATDTASTKTTKDMKTWIKEEYNPSDPEHRAKLDSYLQSVNK